jgi:hypothetical protein
MKKTLIVALLCSASVVGVSAGSAFAGEYNGHGKGTPIYSDKEDPTNQVGNVVVMASNCSFSGLEDGGDYVGQPFGPGVTQTPAMYGGQVAGQACRGSGGGAVKP